MTTWLQYESASPREKNAIATQWYMIWHQYSLGSELARKLYFKHCSINGPLRRSPKLKDDYDDADLSHPYDPVYPSVECGR